MTPPRPIPDDELPAALAAAHAHLGIPDPRPDWMR